MFNASQIRWLVTALAAAAATLAMAAPAGAWVVLDDAGGTGSTTGSTVGANPQILSNTLHEGRLADQRLGNQDATVSSSQATPNVSERASTRPDSSAGTVSTGTVSTDRPFTRPDSSAGTTSVADLRNRDHVVTDKAAPAAPTIPYLSHGEGVSESYGETYIPGVTDSTTGVYRALGIEPPTVATTREVSDDSFNWSSDLVIGISAALATALLMALGTVALVGQRRRRMAL